MSRYFESQVRYSHPIGDRNERPEILSIQAVRQATQDHSGRAGSKGKSCLNGGSFQAGTGRRSEIVGEDND